MQEKRDREVREAVQYAEQMERAAAQAERKAEQAAAQAAAQAEQETKKKAVLKALQRGKLSVEEIADDNEVRIEFVLRIEKEMKK